MSALHLPWLELLLLVPLAGALWVSRMADAAAARLRSLAVQGVTLALAAGSAADFYLLREPGGAAVGGLREAIAGGPWLGLDDLSAPWVPLAALLYGLATAATLPTKVRRFSFSWTLYSEFLLLGLLTCRDPWGMVGFLVLGAIPPWVELRARGKATSVYSLHMGLFAAALIAGWWLAERPGGGTALAPGAACLLVLAVAIRSGLAPMHCWLADLFDRATFGTALLFVAPIPGAYAAARLLLPRAPAWALGTLLTLSVVTAVYAAGMALVQREARRFFAYLFISRSALVVVGLAVASPISLTGALSVWLSVGLAQTGFGLTLRSIEARAGRLELAEWHGMYDRTPALAALFLLTGLASVGFPGTLGFVGTEVLVDGAVQASPYLGGAVLLATALNGIAVVRVYFTLFAGPRSCTSVSLRSRVIERCAVLTLAVLILGGGWMPQPAIDAHFRVATDLSARRPVSTRRPAPPANPRPLGESSLRAPRAGREERPQAVRPLPAPSVGDHSRARRSRPSSYGSR